MQLLEELSEKESLYPLASSSLFINIEASFSQSPFSNDKVVELLTGKTPCRTSSCKGSGMICIPELYTLSSTERWQDMKE